MAEAGRLRLLLRLLLLCTLVSYCNGDEFAVVLGRGSSTICYDGIVPPVVRSFSICTFINLHRASPGANVFQYKHAAGVSFKIEVTYFGIALRIQGNRDTTYGSEDNSTDSDQTYFFETTLPPRTWRGMCFTYDGLTSVARCYIDGKREQISSTTTMKTDNMMKDMMLSYSQRNKRSIGSSNRYRRQTDKSICAGSDEIEGELAGLQIWNNALVETDAMRKSNCKRSKLASSGNIINLNNEWKFYGNSSKLSYPRAELCTNLDTAIMLKPAGSFPEAKEYCIGIGGHLTEPAVITPELLTLAKGVNNICIGWDRAVSWLTHTVTNPNIETKFCEALDVDGKISFITCVRRLDCSLCIAPIERFTLYGHTGEYFDYVYYLSANALGEPAWKGVRGSNVVRDNGTWYIRSDQHETELSLPDHSLPVGRNSWKWMTRVVGRPAQTVLTFTVCRTTQFCCDDGQCLSIVLRCDDVIDCRDSSDEKDCNILRTPPGYDKLYIPPAQTNETVPVKLGYHLDVYNLGRITTDEGRARIDLGLTMTWYDSRVGFRNLKPVQKNYFDCPIIWLPRLRAVTGHGDGSVLDINRYENFCYVYADDQEEIRALTDPLMGYASPGIAYPLKYYLGILADLPCEFNFVRYPFDTQMCNVSFMVMNAAGQRYFSKYTVGNTVPYLNKKLILLEYRLSNITTEVGYNVKGTDNNTYFVVSLHLERLYGYHIMNSFFPSLLMGFVSYSTFFFQVDDFTNRIMISLTAQLVLAALFTSTTASSVKTPYLKMIDVWYACVIAYCFTIVISQVIIDWIRNRVELILKVEGRKDDDKVDADGKKKKRSFWSIRGIMESMQKEFVLNINNIMRILLLFMLLLFIMVYTLVATGFY